MSDMSDTSDMSETKGLPSSYFWTWDHSTNWVLDDPGIQSSGCYNRYFKRPETFVEDYRRLVDASADLGIAGIVVWGFLRDSHGGIDSARRVADYAKSRGVGIMPGFGVTWYGGPYYEGDHRFSLDRFLDKNPDARMLDEDGFPREHCGEFGACLAHRGFQSWLKEGLHWLFDTFDISGLNLENGDLLTDCHPDVQELRKEWPADDAEPFFHQGKAYGLALDACGTRVKDRLCTYATYTGFNFSDTITQEYGMGTGMGPRVPAMFSMLPEDAVCQWTLTGMLLKDPLPLTAYLDNGAPDQAFVNPNWPADLRPPGARSVGFVHQGSQWSQASRYECVVSSIKEACLRSVRSGLEGVSIHGEVSDRVVPCALNYLAFSHFIRRPEDSLREFGRTTLARRLGSPDAGETFVEILARCDAGTLTEDDRKCSVPAFHGLSVDRRGGADCDNEKYVRFRFWHWLNQSVRAGRLLQGCIEL